MTPQQIRIAMAEVDDYSHIIEDFNQSGETKGLKTDGVYTSSFYRHIPDYLNDRNATWRVLEGMELMERFHVYEKALNSFGKVGIATAQTTFKDIDLIVTAPLPTIIRAILEVKGKWVEV